MIGNATIESFLEVMSQTNAAGQNV